MIFIGVMQRKYIVPMAAGTNTFDVIVPPNHVYMVKFTSPKNVDAGNRVIASYIYLGDGATFVNAVQSHTVAATVTDDDYVNVYGLERNAMDTMPAVAGSIIRIIWVAMTGGNTAICCLTADVYRI